jgi:hypothetical protein
VSMSSSFTREFFLLADFLWNLPRLVNCNCHIWSCLFIDALRMISLDFAGAFVNSM